MSKKYRVQGISFPDEQVYLAAKAKAAAQRRTLSNYICGLLEADLAQELKDAPPPSSANAAAAADTAAKKIVYTIRKPRKPVA